MPQNGCLVVEAALALALKPGNNLVAAPIVPMPENDWP
jgi:hypothetical protein